MAISAIARSVAAALAVLAAGGLAQGQTELSLRQVSARVGANYVPAYENQEVMVRGTVSARAIPLLNYVHIAIQDTDYYGLVLKADPGVLERLEPGQQVLVQGKIIKHGGMPVLTPKEIRVLSRGTAPEPRRVRLAELSGFRYMGVLVETEGDVVNTGQNTGGDYVNIGDVNRPIKVFLPSESRGALGEFSRGDRIRLTAIAMQYCPLPPHNRYYQLLIGTPSRVRVLERRWLVPPAALLAGLLTLIAALGIWLLREKRMAAQRVAMRALNTLSESILSAESPGDIASRLAGTLPDIWKLTAVHLYLYNKANRKLERVKASPEDEPRSIAVDAAIGCVHGGAALCLRNRTLLHMPDTRRSPFYSPTETPAPPRSLLFVPAFSQGEILGVVQMESEFERRQFNRDEQAAAEHVGNLIAASLRLQEQLSVREHLFRGDRVASSGQLILSVATELAAPVQTVATLAAKLTSRKGDAEWDADLKALNLETLRASEVLTRLMNVAKSERATAEPLDLREMLNKLLESRERDHALAGIAIRNLTGPDAVMAMGSGAQIEQVVLNLLLHAEHAVREAVDRTITVQTRAKDKRMSLEISFPSDWKDAGDAVGGALSIGVCQGIVQNHGGSLRVIRPQPSHCRFDMELPSAKLAEAAEAAAAPQARSTPAQSLTALIVEPDAAAQRRLVRFLDSRGHRAVPVTSSDEGVDLAQRIRFDLSFCSMNVESLNWVQFFQRVRHDVGSFILLSDSRDPDLARIFDGGGGFLLNKPIEENDLDHLLEAIEATAPAPEMVGNT